jgi:taurine dioxygenase
MIRTEPLSSRFGIAVQGLDVTQPLDTDTACWLLDLLYAHRVLAVRGQQLDAPAFGAYCSHFGRKSIRHVLTRGSEPPVPEVPDLLPLSNKYRGGGATEWHTDQSYEAERAVTTLLYCRHAPKRGGETRFIDMVAAYDALPDARRAEIDDLTVVHQWGRGIAVADDDGWEGIRRSRPQNASHYFDADTDSRHPLVHHPLVLRHPVTGIKALYSPWATARGIEGMLLQDARELLVSLRDHCLKPEFRYHHKYQVGDVVAWDTQATMHAAMPIDKATGPDDLRLLWRISLRGMPLALDGERRSPRADVVPGDGDPDRVAAL